MISIGNVVSVAAGVAYYDEAVADSQVDYYAARGEAPGIWRGAAAPELELAGRVERDALVRVLEGRDPRSGEELGRHYGSRKNVAFDVTYSVPKSVSLLYALGDERTRWSVLRALDAGAATAHGYLERHAGWARVYNRVEDRVGRVRAEFVTASFVHRTARPVTRDGVTTVDPQLHVHLLVSSFVRRANGTWGQLYSEPLYAHAAAAGALGQAATRDVLVRELGVRVRTNPNGTFEIEGFTVEQLAEFSQRHRQTLAAAAAAGASSLYGTKVAVLDTRESKSAIEPGVDLFAQWAQRASAVGVNRDGVAALLDQEQVRELRWFDVDTVRELLGRGEYGLTAQASVFTRRDLVRSLAAHAPLGMRSEPIETLADAILAEPGAVVPMVPPAEGATSPGEATQRWVERGMEVHYSTPEVVALERRMLETAQARRGESVAVIDGGVAERAIEQSGVHLTEGQSALVKQVCTSPDGVVVVEGAAGTGKTTAMRVIRDAYAACGGTVVGCAPSGRAAVGLQQEAGIPSFTTASLLSQLRAGERLPREGVVIADESSMLGPDLAELVLHASQHRAKLVLVGDSQQLQPIDGGALFRSLGNHLGRIELTEVIRQREQWDREALMAFRLGRTATLVRRYMDEGRVHSSPDERERLATMAADWVAATRDGHDVVSVARERTAVAALNVVTRAAAVEAGLVATTGVVRQCHDLMGRKLVDLGELEFAVGDRVLVVGRNMRRLRLVKGLRGTVARIDGDGALVVDSAGAQGRVTIPASYPGVCHGYALTVHRAQGATADVALVHGTVAAVRQWLYVALSRHRFRAVYYDVAPPDRDVDGVHHGPTARDQSLEERLCAAASRDGSKASTLDYPREYDRQLLRAHAAAGPDGGTTAEPTEKQLEILRSHGVVDDLPPVPTWVHASLLVDEIVGSRLGAQARTWLAEGGVPDGEVERVIDMAHRDIAATRRTWAVPRDRAAGAAPLASRTRDRTDDGTRRRAALRGARRVRSIQRGRAEQRRRDQERGRSIG